MEAHRVRRRRHAWTPVWFPAPSTGSSSWVIAAVRAGCTAEGLAYAVVGATALGIALDSGGWVGGGPGPLAFLAEGPAGPILLILLVTGLMGHALWRLASTAEAPNADGRDRITPWTAGRGLHLTDAIAHGFLAWLAAEALLGGGVGSGETPLSGPLGPALVGGAGLVLVGAGALQIASARGRSVRTKARSSHLGRTQARWMARFAHFGITARGGAFVVIGVHLLQSALRLPRTDALQIDAILEPMVARPWLLGVLGAGLLAYAVLQWSKARYRVISR